MSQTNTGTLSETFLHHLQDEIAAQTADETAAAQQPAAASPAVASAAASTPAASTPAASTPAQPATAQTVPTPSEAAIQAITVALDRLIRNPSHITAGAAAGVIVQEISALVAPTSTAAQS